MFVAPKSEDLSLTLNPAETEVEERVVDIVGEFLVIGIGVAVELLGAVVDVVPLGADVEVEVEEFVEVDFGDGVEVGNEFEFVAVLGVVGVFVAGGFVFAVGLPVEPVGLKLFVVWLVMLRSRPSAFN